MGCYGNQRTAVVNKAVDVVNVMVVVFNRDVFDIYAFFSLSGYCRGMT